MKLNQTTLDQTAFWAGARVKPPAFDCVKMRANTLKAPVWVRFGAGSIFRGYIAALQQRLLNHGLASSGGVAAETFDSGIIDDIYTPCDNLSLQATSDAKIHLNATHVHCAVLP